jgi:hypothetical protein
MSAILLVDAKLGALLSAGRILAVQVRGKAKPKVATNRQLEVSSSQTFPVIVSFCCWAINKTLF